jgi:hypothetical protein
MSRSLIVNFCLRHADNLRGGSTGSSTTTYPPRRQSGTEHPLALTLVTLLKGLSREMDLAFHRQLLSVQIQGKPVHFYQYTLHNYSILHS